MSKSINSFDNYPDWLIKKWQEIADLLADMLYIPSALIMKTENEVMEVFISSNSENNPYHVGDKENWHGLYCETVIKTQGKLLISNARKDSNWDNNPDIKLGMIAYLGFPINFPDNQPFGTICILDNKENHFSPQHEKLLLQFKNVLELDLALIQSFNLKTKELAKTIQEQQSQLLNNNIVLKKALQNVEESDRLKTAFLQNMSHEIRTPMNAIMGFSELIVRNFNNKPKLEKFSEIIKLRCGDLLEIINDILDISKIESGQLTVDNTECRLTDLFSDLSDFFIEYKNRIGKQHIELKFKIEVDSSENIVFIDSVKLKQIFINLISNAFKFTPIGEIVCGCKVEGDNLLFYVSDTGIGIPMDQQKRIFDRFLQLRNESKNEIKGTGLGLSIVKGLVKLLGGDIMLDSKPSIGSTFSFLIPYQKVSSKTDTALQVNINSNLHLNNKTILIVEDDIYNAQYLKELLSDLGLNILEAKSGQEAIEVSLSQTIDLILMDIQLPDMNGYDVISQIKRYKPNIKIISQTAFASLDDKQKAFNAGCNDYISKPIKQDLLILMINQNLA